jgi:hypothetical protein
MLESELRLPVFKWLAVNNIPFRYEVPLPWGRADVVGIDRRDEDTIFNSKNLVGLSVPTRARLLSMISQYGAVGCPVDRILADFENHLESEEIAAHLKFLEKRQWIRGVGGGMTSRRLIAVGLSRRPRLISVELKLTRTSEVVKQALRNQVFSSRTYVALPAQHASYLVRSNLEELERTGLGILSVCGNKCIEIKSAAFKKTEDLGLELQLLAHLRRSITQEHSASELQQRAMH